VRSGNISDVFEACNGWGLSSVGWKGARRRGQDGEIGDATYGRSSWRYFSDNLTDVEKKSNWVKERR